MIDLHCHLLPGIDDGPRDLDASLEMCRLAAADGCTLAVATPHQRHPAWPNLDRALLEARFAELVEAVGDLLELRLGAEIRVDSDLLDDLDSLPAGELLPLAGSRALLLELDHSGWGPDPAEIIHELVLGRWRPVLAHPEHIAGLAHDIDRLGELVEAGACMQLTAMSVTGQFGRPASDAAWRMLEAELVHVVASDAHSPEWRPPGLRLARELVDDRLGAPWGRRLTIDNPRALLDGRPLADLVEVQE